MQKCFGGSPGSSVAFLSINRQVYGWSHESESIKAVLMAFFVGSTSKVKLYLTNIALKCEKSYSNLAWLQSYNVPYPKIFSLPYYREGSMDFRMLPIIPRLIKPG